MMSSSSEFYNIISIYRVEVNPPACGAINLCRSSEKHGSLTTQLVASTIAQNQCCSFFQWLEPTLPKHYKDTIWNMKLRIDDLLVRNAQVVELQKKVEKHKLLRKAEKDLLRLGSKNYSLRFKV
ncbi:unnamed protein product [Lactuca virosa]|uniref:Uncharacterized protein n=1 Tax=Lactuca virosa TaxID=75947 RepID=A0AAU9PEI2_9ASTR|nr:unnamed protein product [Lactuca virosa]